MEMIGLTLSTAEQIIGYINNHMLYKYTHIYIQILYDFIHKVFLFLPMVLFSFYFVCDFTC